MGQIKNIKLHIVTDIKSKQHGIVPPETLTFTTMKLYKDIFTGKDVCTDSFKVELVDDLYYKFCGKYIVEDLSVDGALLGANKSEEAEDEEEEDNKRLIADLVTANCLVEANCRIISKKDFKDWIKEYAANLIKKVGEKDTERADFLKKNLPLFVKDILGKFKEIRFYASKDDELDLEGGLIYLEQPGTKDGEEKEGTECHIMVLKDAVEEENC